MNRKFKHWLTNLGATVVALVIIFSIHVIPGIIADYNNMQVMRLIEMSLSEEIMHSIVAFLVAAIILSLTVGQVIYWILHKLKRILKSKILKWYFAPTFISAPTIYAVFYILGRIITG